MGISSVISPAILQALRRKQLGTADFPRMDAADEARGLLYDDPADESNRLMYGDEAAGILRGGSSPSPVPLGDRPSMPNAGAGIGGAAGGVAAQKLDMPRMGTEGMGDMPMPGRAGGDLKSRLLHAGQGALMGLANARRNPTNPDDWGAVVGSAVGGAIGGGANPQGIEDAKYYERDLPRWYETQKMQADLANRDRMQRMSEAQIENLRTDNERAAEEFTQRKTEFEQRQQLRMAEDWDRGHNTTPLSAEDATKMGRPDWTGRLPSGGKLTGKGTQFNTSEGIFDRMPDGSAKPVMSPNTRSQPVESAAFSGITTGEAPHQLQPYSAPKAPAAPRLTDGGRQMLVDGKLVPTPGYTAPPEKGETPVQARTRERQEQQDEREQQKRYETIQRELGVAQAKRQERAGHRNAKGELTATKEELDALDAQIADLKDQAQTNNPAKMKKRAVKAGGVSSGQRRSIDDVKAAARADVKAAGETAAAKKAFRDAFGEDY